MSSHRVTLAIPTYNRSKLLGISLQSAIEQDYGDIQVIVLDNASTDDTREVVGSFNDPRITYIRNETNIGLYRNWNRAIELNENPYLCLLQDDDVLIPGFVSASCKALGKCSSAAFSFTYAIGIDIDGRVVAIQNPDNVTEGKIDGLDYLHRIVAGENFVIHASSVMMRSAALSDVGAFDITHSKHSIDFNLYFRFAAKYDIAFIAEKLVKIRRHEGADHRVSLKGCGPLSMAAERMDAGAYLLQSTKADDRTYRLWLAERLLYLGMLRSEYSSQLLPDLNIGWQVKRDLAQREIEDLLPEGSKLILVDQGVMDPESFNLLTVLPFVERGGKYWGPPKDDADAIREMEEMRQQKVNYLVFAWSAFWWFDYYKGWRENLVTHFRCIFKNSRLIVFELLPVENPSKKSKIASDLQDAMFEA